MEGDLSAFKEALLKELKEEYEAIKENLAMGRVVTPEAPYDYWLGQCITYKFVIDLVRTKYKRIEGELFQDDLDDGGE